MKIEYISNALFKYKLAMDKSWVQNKRGRLNCKSHLVLDYAFPNLVQTISSNGIWCLRFVWGLDDRVWLCQRVRSIFHQNTVFSNEFSIARFRFWFSRIWNHSKRKRQLHSLRRSYLVFDRILSVMCDNLTSFNDGWTLYLTFLPCGITFVRWFNLSVEHALCMV